MNKGLRVLVLFLPNGFIMKQLLFLAISIISFTSFQSCKEDPSSTVTLPSNLEVSVSQEIEFPGQVDLEASADMANFYYFIFSEGTEETYLESKDGTASYTYSESGDYEIIVRAHATYDDFIETTEEVLVTIEETPGNNGNPPSTGYTTPDTYPEYTLVWQDEFNGTSLNTDDWNYELGTGNSGWGNNELQYYKEENTTVADGYLIITALEESFAGSDYTSSRFTTEAKQEFQYGRIDIRAAMPYGKGLWPALWMLGSDFSTGGWPQCGEIDIMEMVGGNVAGGGNDVVHGTVHWDNDGQYANFGGSRVMPDPLANNFHVYSIIWDEDKIEWYIDDNKYHTIDITPSGLSEFHQDFFFIFNVAVGGNWPGSPNSATEFPQRMYVDYVRVFQ